jgi:hypothetical protein
MALRSATCGSKRTMFVLVIFSTAHGHRFSILGLGRVSKWILRERNRERLATAAEMHDRFVTCVRNTINSSHGWRHRSADAPGVHRVVGGHDRDLFKKNARARPARSCRRKPGPASSVGRSYEARSMCVCDEATTLHAPRPSPETRAGNRRATAPR